MVVGDRVVTAKFQDLGEGVADHRRADMAHVHRLGDVRAAEVDDDRLRRGDRRDSHPRIADSRDDRPGQRILADTKVDEARAHRLRRYLKQVAHVEPADDFNGHIPRLEPRPFGQRHRHRAGIIAKFRVGRLTDLVHEPGQFLGRDAHDTIRRQPLKCRPEQAAKSPAKRGPSQRILQRIPERILYRRAALIAACRGHRDVPSAEAAAGSGTVLQPLQSCSRSQYSRASASNRCTTTSP